MKNYTFLFGLVLAIVIGCNSNKAGYETLFNENFKLYPNMLTESSRSEATEESAHARLMAPYDKGDFKSALAEFSVYLQKNPADYQVTFYRGLVYLKLNETDRAMSDFEAVINNNDTKFKEQAEWYMALSLVKSQKKNEAVTLLTSMADNNKSYGERATYLLSKIEEWPG